MSEDNDSKPDGGGVAPDAIRADKNESHQDVSANGSLGTPSADALEETRVPPEWREWARQQHNEEEFLRGLKEVQEKGGLAFEDFFDDLVNEVSNGREDA
jgi:hypothetical protein